MILVVLLLAVVEVEVAVRLMLLARVVKTGGSNLPCPATCKRLPMRYETGGTVAMIATPTVVRVMTTTTTTKMMLLLMLSMMMGVVLVMMVAIQSRSLGKTSKPLQLPRPTEKSAEAKVSIGE